MWPLFEISGADKIDVEFAEYPKRLQRVVVRSLNRAIKSGESVMVKAIGGDTGLKQKDIRDAIVRRDASESRPEASIAAKLKRIPLIDFNARGPEPSRGRGRGVSYRLRGSKGRIENAFIATMRSGHRGVYRRAGTARLKIIELFGPSIGEVFKKHRPAGIARAHEVFDKNFDHELGFASGGVDVGTD